MKESELGGDGAHFVYYKRRYYILVLLGTFTATNFYQHYEFAAIANVVSDFYGITDSDVNWTSLLYNIGSVLMFYPIMKCIENYGFLVTTIIVTFCEALGTCIKCLAVNERFYGLLLFGQAFPAFVTIAQPSLSAIFGANWFKSEHVAAIIGLNTIFLNAGSAFAFVTPSLFTSTKQSDIKSGLSIVSISLSAVTCTTFILTVLIAREKPPTPPSLAQKAREEQQVNYCLKDLLKNKNFILLIIIFAMVITLSQTTSVILNQSILAAFPNENHIITVAGILSLVPGIPSSLIAGYLCKLCRRYKLLLILYCTLVLIFMGVYTVSLWLRSEALVYFSIFMTGFFYAGVYVISMDFIVEVTYPCSEGITVNIATLIACLPSILCIPMTSTLIKSYGAAIGNTLLVTSAAINVMAALFVTEDMRRYKANTESCFTENCHLLTNNSLK